MISRLYFENFDDKDSTFYVDFYDGLQVVFCPYPWPVDPPRLSYAQLRVGASGEELTPRFNVYADEGGGRFTEIPPRAEHRQNLGVHWELAYEFLRPVGFQTLEQQRAWSYVKGTLIYAQQLQRPPRKGLF